MSIKNRIEKLELSVLIKTEPVKLRPKLSREQWLNVFGGQNIEAEPLSIDQQEWVDKYGRVS